APQELVIGHAPIRLGMSMNEVSQTFHDPFYADDSLQQPSGGAVMWPIRERRGEVGYLLGTVQFLNGRVFRVSRDVGTFETKDSLEFGRVLATVLERLKENDPTAAVVVNTFVGTPKQGEMKSITIGTGMRRVGIIVASPVTISEELTNSPPPKKQPTK